MYTIAAWAGFPAAVKQVNDTAYRLFSAFLRVFRDGFQGEGVSSLDFFIKLGIYEVQLEPLQQLRPVFLKRNSMLSFNLSLIVSETAEIT